MNASDIKHSWGIVQYITRRWHKWCVYYDILSHIAKYGFSFKFLNSLHRVRCERSLLKTILCSLELSSSHRCHRSCPKDRSISVCSSTSTRCQRKKHRAGSPGSPCRFTGRSGATISWKPGNLSNQSCQGCFCFAELPCTSFSAPKTWLREKDQAASTIKTLPDFTVRISLKQKSV